MMMISLVSREKRHIITGTRYSCSMRVEVEATENFREGYGGLQSKRNCSGFYEDCKDNGTKKDGHKTRELQRWCDDVVIYTMDELLGNEL
jgi:hypothetical protein